ncbi:uncharacterized protein LOC128551214 [Mercenaria mercenaria]|uniref:uncharacterized protein LOC128551214 n=1 Tax=Mercenaria mercenaria TaxID=6596 RepID=UPI00234FABF4|nr:uncharacterized protein LOC128551214 [Mercenaria mercenaria]
MENKKESDKPTFDFTESSQTTDFVLNVKGTKLFVAKNILSLASPVFERSFRSDYKENLKNEMDLPGKKSEDVIEFLSCIYPSTLSEITYENVLRILPLVEEYQVLHLKPRCEKVLLDGIGENTKIEELFLVLKETCLYDLNDVREKCITHAVTKTKEDIDNAFKKHQIPADILIDILGRKVQDLEASNKELEVKSEDQTCQFLQRVTDMRIEIKTQREYIEKCMNITEDLGLDEGLNWRKSEIILKVSFSETINALLNYMSKYNTGRNVFLWNMPFTVSFRYLDRGEFVEQEHVRNEWLFIRIHHKGSRRIYSEIRLRCTLLNSRNKTENEVICTKGKFGHDQYTEHAIKRSSDLRGYLLDGCAWILVQIFVSKPDE